MNDLTNSIASVPGVSNVVRLNENNYAVYFDPNANREQVKWEIGQTVESTDFDGSSNAGCWWGNE